MDEKRRTEALRQARGTWQREIVREMLDGPVVNPISRLKGRAKFYAPRYERSFRALLLRLMEAHFMIERTPGPRGGEWAASYTLRNPR